MESFTWSGSSSGEQECDGVRTTLSLFMKVNTNILLMMTSGDVRNFMTEPLTVCLSSLEQLVGNRPDRVDRRHKNMFITEGFHTTYED